MVNVSTCILIDRPAFVVAEFAANPDNAPAWYVNIKSVEWKSPPPLAVGSRLGFVAHFLGRTLVYTYEVVRYDPGACLVMRTAEGPFPMETVYEWREITASRTEMTLRNSGSPSGFIAVIAPLMSAAMRRANRKDLARLKAILEKGI